MCEVYRFAKLVYGIYHQYRNLQMYRMSTDTDSDIGTQPKCQPTPRCDNDV